MLEPWRRSASFKTEGERPPARPSRVAEWFWVLLGSSVLGALITGGVVLFGSVILVRRYGWHADEWTVTIEDYYRWLSFSMLGGGAVGFVAAIRVLIGTPAHRRRGIMGRGDGRF